MTETLIKPSLIDELYLRGKVCITAAKSAHTDFKYRPYLALFADGTFLADDRAQNDVVLQNLIAEFCVAYPSQKRQKVQFVPPTVLKAVYRRAQDFDWYLPQYHVPADLSAGEKHKLRGFLVRILQRQCLSVTTLTTPDWFRFYSPDKGHFALFADGWLTIAENSPCLNDLPHQICDLYPQIQMVEVVPQYYIDAVYERLLYTEPSAREIYIDLVRQKVMRRLKISAAEALEVMQKQTYGWRRLLFLDEKLARSMIYSAYVEDCFIKEDVLFAAQMADKKDFHIGSFI